MAFNSPLSKLQLYSPRNWSGLSEENNLRNAYMTQPAEVKAVLAYALSSTYYNKKGTSVMALLTDGVGASEEITSEEYQWNVYGANERSIPCIGNLEANNSTPGYGGAEFRVILAEKYFAATDTLIADDRTQVRMQIEPYLGSGGWVHTFRLHGDNTSFIDPIMISAGASFSKQFSAVEELSIKGGSTNFAAPFKMRNRLTTLRKNHAFSRNVLTDLLVIEMPAINDPKGPTTKLWFTLAEWNFMAQWGKEKDNAMIHGQHSGDFPVPGENGRPVLMGAGLRQQISPANIRFYNKLTYKLLDDLLSDLSYASQKNGGDTNFIAFTGRQGLRAFSDAISDKFKSLGVTILAGQGQYIGGTGNKLTFLGDQWVTANFPNGVTLTIKYMPMYDDLIDNRILDPNTGRPTESLRFSLFNIGNNSDGQPGIKKYVKKDSEDIYGITAGMYNPYDLPNSKHNTFNKPMSSGLDGCEIFALTQEGICLADPTSASELIYSVS